MLFLCHLIFNLLNRLISISQIFEHVVYLLMYDLRVLTRCDRHQCTREQ